MLTSLRPRTFAFIALVAFGLAGAARETGDAPRRMARLALTLPAADLPRLAAGGFEIVAVAPDGAWADVILPRDGDARGRIGFEVLEERELDGTYAPDGGYKTPDEVQTLLRDYERRYPELLTLRSIGRSGEGRDIWAVRITRQSYAGIVTKPAILFNAMHHAREVMSTEVALDTIEQLLTRYGSDERVTRWVDENEIWIVPMLNVDGSNRVWTRDSMWRKNTSGGHGVDVNRNYPHKWGACNGSSGNRSDDTYRGPRAASEPETQALIALAREIRPVFNISYHSYGEMVLYPYGCQGERTARTDVVESIGKEMAALLRTDDGRGTYKAGTSWELLYAVDGGDIDWMHAELQTNAYVIEVNGGFANGGFQPPYSMRDPTVRKLRAAWELLLDRADGPGIRGRVTDGAGRGLGKAKLTITSLSASGLTPHVATAHDDGSFHVVLKPGRYRVRFEAQGRAEERELTVATMRRSLSITL